MYGINTTQGKKGEKNSKFKRERLLMTKPQRKKTNQGFHYQVPFIDDSKEKKMVPFVDALMAKTKPKRIMVVRNFFFDMLQHTI